MKRASRYYFLLVPVVLVAGVLAAGVWFVNHRAPVMVSDDIRENLARGGRIAVAVQELSNASNPLFEYEYVVIDRGRGGAEAAVREQISRMRESGWELESATSGRWHLRSDKYQTVADVQFLSAFIQEWGNGDNIYPEERAASKIAATVGDVSSLIIVTLRHFG
ncbi:hypothetical protein [Microtetraspora sp. NBRC 16547]|uniref:hypothetical protein n=1 Tax=Microtetraspora sp. NBRC 16547 TaxID=3030993 RepID=UPI0024A4C63F|nr:hypothetical protein [Microtetraspora sp. NBRC 16547]GLX02752.1 hypothetical protein Misp02_68380 [Microtetraspora sp. NBRC 16547]